MLQRIEKDLAVAFQQRVQQIKAGDVRRRIEPVVQPAAARQDLQVPVEQHNDTQPKPEGRGGDPGHRH